ncbi:hypothetical protein [Streptomyces sp. CC224B]|uniref:restriction endonuclease subunit S n=1 Tax=Streptomyces sp. CC224B TaxID=3044571 RepID=UPI0024A7B8D3|nr:hypothetical protein [Streptomyces sp. CC224B]
MPNDILLVEGHADPMQIGRCALVRPELAGLLYQNHLFRLRFDGVLPEFALIWLNSRYVRDYWLTHCATSSGLYTINSKLLGRAPFLVLPEDEQRRIVAAHAAFERRISGLERVREKVRVAARATLAAALQDPAHGEGVKLGTVLRESPRNGYSPKPVPGWSGLQALGLGCLTADGFSPVQLKNVPDTPLARTALLSDGDLLMSRANTRELVGLVGRFESTGRPCIYPDLMMRLRSDTDRCLTEYLELVLRSDAMRKVVTSGARGTSESMVKIGAEQVKSLRIPLPSIEQQGRIVAVQAVFTRRSKALAAQIAKLRTVQQAVVEDLLGGRASASAA